MKYKIAKIAQVFGVLLLMACTPGESGTTGETPHFVQVISGTLDAGLSTYRSVRVDSDGTIEAASWDDEGVLYSLSERIKGSADGYESFAKLISHQNPEASLGRRVNTIDVAVVNSSTIQFTSFDQFPEDSAQTFETAFASVPASPLTPGRYILLAPYTQVGTIDIDLTDTSCQSKLACDVKDAIETGKTAFNAPDDLDSFLQDGRKNRVQFGVETKQGRYRFWIVQTR